MTWIEEQKLKRREEIWEALRINVDSECPRPLETVAVEYNISTATVRRIEKQFREQGRRQLLVRAR